MIALVYSPIHYKAAFKLSIKKKVAFKEDILTALYPSEEAKSSHPSISIVI